MYLLSRLFITFIVIGTFSFGGGNAMYPLLLRELVENHGWLTKGELVDLFAFAQMTPGPVATNVATYAGYKLAGIPGALTATMGVSLPSAAVMLIMIRFLMTHYESRTVKGILGGLRPVVVALILAAAVIIAGDSMENILTYILLAGSFFGAAYLKIHPILLIITAGLVGIIFL
ncbi:MAG: chromate transporter [Clostridia bacterium]|nr:chromate transporter [Clostridia bacterium]